MGQGLDNLTKECEDMVHQAFDSFDIDHSDAIDLDECLRHWGQKGFGRISAKEFLRTVDMDGNGEIEFDEFLRFWKVVKDCGHTEEEIMEELERIKNGESWVGFQNLPKEYCAGSAEIMKKSVEKVEEEEDNAGGIRFAPVAKKMGEGLDNLSADALKYVEAAFASFDIDNSQAIDLQEALRHWKGGFGKISAKAFFKTVDMDGNGEIEYDEFLRFWKVVKESGHDEEEIKEELERIKNGEHWVGFNNLPFQFGL